MGRFEPGKKEIQPVKGGKPKMVVGENVLGFDVHRLARKVGSRRPKYYNPRASCPLWPSNHPPIDTSAVTYGLRRLELLVAGFMYAIRFSLVLIKFENKVYNAYMERLPIRFGISGFLKFAMFVMPFLNIASVLCLLPLPVPVPSTSVAICNLYLTVHQSILIIFPHADGASSLRASSLRSSKWCANV